MIVPFTKYQGTGNDFIIIDNRELQYRELDVAALCHRRFGIGADGLMLLQKAEGYDFEMVYYNSDGNLSSMCGNGGRCIAHFAHSLGLGSGNNLHFIAVDGPHKAFVKANQVELQMIDVNHWEVRNSHCVVLNTGSPHYIQFIEENTGDFDLIPFSKNIRYSAEFGKEGINVNVVQQIGDNALAMRTYERGVEDETYSCGTGVTAAALSFALLNPKTGNIKISTAGGELEVRFKQADKGFSDVWLCGPAEKVFTGEISA